MAVNRGPISEAEVKRWFLDSEAPPKNTFDLALVLGGTVAAGAYTAGVMDYLVEALDEWSRLKAEGNAAAPRHNMRLRMITGTSGGGVIAAIAARALAYRVQPASHARLSALEGGGTPDKRTGNPFYDTWVHDLSLADFLKDDDIDGKGEKVRSLLNGTAIDRAAARVIAFHGEPAGERSWVAGPLRVTMTVTNLCGIPYRTALSGGPGQYHVNHADYARFAVTYPWQRRPDPTDQRPDEWHVGFEGGGEAAWQRFAEYAKATGAFPVGFPARALERPVEHYRYRVAVLPGMEGKPARAIPMVPYWDGLEDPGSGDVPETYRFLAVDGGATDNEPIQLARTAMSGCLGHNPRAPNKADRAVLLIDPFAERAELGLRTQASLPAVAKAVIGTLKDQNRFATSDLLLANDPDVFSRFMITPRGRLGGTDRIGGEALATAGLGAFIGFACKEYMRHDYLLGRANAKAFLEEEFMLREDNPVFAGAWTDEQKGHFGRREPDGLYLPIIPVMGTAADDQQLMPWPSGKLDTEAMRKGIERRIKALAKAGGGDGLVGFGVDVATLLWSDDLAESLMGAVEEHLKAAKLA